MIMTIWRKFPRWAKPFRVPIVSRDIINRQEHVFALMMTETNRRNDVMHRAIP